MRRACKILMFLVLGLLTTVAVSWALAMWRTVPMYPAPSQSRIVERAFVKWDRGWSIIEKHMIGVMDSWWTDLGFDDPDLSHQAQVEQHKESFQKRQSNNAFLVNAIYLDREPHWGTFAAPHSPPGGIQIGCDVAFGWPRPCLWFGTMANLVHIPRGIQTTNPRLTYGILVDGTIDCPGYRGFRALPLRPIWSALVINATLYGILWCLVLFGPGWLRLAYRRHHNLCEHCGYSLAGNPGTNGGCPECGWRRC